MSAGLRRSVESLLRYFFIAAIDYRDLKLEGQTQEIGASLVHATDAYFLGRGILYPIALEGALKLKEISYIHAEGYAAELKHGPIALIDDGVPVIVLSSTDALNEKTQSNAAEVAARVRV